MRITWSHECYPTQLKVESSSQLETLQEHWSSDLQYNRVPSSRREMWSDVKWQERSSRTALHALLHMNFALQYDKGNAHKKTRRKVINKELTYKLWKHVLPLPTQIQEWIINSWQKGLLVALSLLHTYTLHLEKPTLSKASSNGY